MNAVLARACTRLPGSRASVRTARAWATATLTHARVPAALIDDAVLIISELATNAVLHTASGTGGTYALTLETGPDQIRIWVMDDGPAAPPHPRPAHRDGEGGRGLAIVAAYAHSFGPVITPTGTGFQALIRTRDPE